LKYLIVGLGNPGKKYIRTRHNVGFILLDFLSNIYDSSFVERKKANIFKTEIKGSEVAFVKPLTFMNLSGSAVFFWAKKLKIPKENILVILDDISLPFGKIRLRQKGSAGGHNGLDDMFNYFSNNEISRLRFGIGNNFLSGGQSDYVLSDFSQSEFSFIESFSKRLFNIIECFIENGIEETMNSYNNL
tara:strand:+ start:2245 stop:2808 length:564 start_codon:yes stop_codon:yes gene_type:complete